MKKYIFLFILVAFFQTGNSQSISLSNLIDLRNEPLNKVETFLLQKNYQFASSKEETDTSCAIVAFQLESETNSDEIIQYLYSKSNNLQRLWYTTFIKNTYLQLINQAKTLNFKFKENKVQRETLSNLYFKNGMYIIFRTFHLETDKSNSIIMYRIELYTEEDFNKIHPL